MSGFFAGMTPTAVAIVGALAASVAWLAVVVWLMDRSDRLARRHQAAERESARALLSSAAMSDTWLRRNGGQS